MPAHFPSLPFSLSVEYIFAFLSNGIDFVFPSYFNLRASKAAYIIQVDVIEHRAGVYSTHDAELIHHPSLNIERQIQ